MGCLVPDQEIDPAAGRVGVPRSANKRRADVKKQKGLGLSASLIVLIPLVLLGIVTTLCFVGCAQVLGLQPWQNPSIQSPYQSEIAGQSGIVAFWPLSDPPAGADTIATAADAGVHPPPPFDGKYMDGVMLQQKPGIVPGDLLSDSTRM